MNKTVVLKRKNGKYKVPIYIKYLIWNYDFKFEYNGKLYSKEIKTKDKEVKQISMLVECLNTKNKKDRLSLVYDKACDILDDDFYGKNVCEFKCDRCMHDRYFNTVSDCGCCISNDGKKKCEHLTPKGCDTRCLACKFHICFLVRKKEYRYRINDIYVLKYLYSIRQKIIAYFSFFETKDEVMKDIYRNSILLWALKKDNKFKEVK